ncbi:MAG: DUF5107 domain-containing protein, partial [Anaerolineales bacterium]|nr:DUF5107 domain-containing protein [Anaerolineales bacterium]
MSEIHIKPWKFVSAHLGPNNPLPPLFPERKCPQINTKGIPQEIIKQMQVGHLPSILPYSMQSDYNRVSDHTETKVAILENEILRATFLLELGGRLWSLYHKPSGKELLEVNPVIQLANLGIRNAWFSGGVEWNIGTSGHSPFTCDRLFAARLTREDGTPFLRLYEWERFRQVPFQIDVYLPPMSPTLFLYIRIFNPNETEVPMYWWSNIAVPDHPGTRVITPGDTAYYLGLKPNQLAKVSIPFHGEVDLTYPKNYSSAADIFFHIPNSHNPWIAAVDCDGKGLVHTSTQQLIGRKMWTWGVESGGYNWQKFLSPPGKGYLEIQAGLTRTQLEHTTIPAGSELSWMEAYGMIETDPQKAHGSNWHQVQDTVQSAINKLIPSEKLYSEYERAQKYIHHKPDEVLQRGSGWGALERLRRESDNENQMCGPGLIFDD